jgi:hypothetical protein
MPNTIYPYVRTRATAARRHVFLSAFAFLPGTMGEAIRWERADGGAFLALGARRMVVLAGPDRRIDGISCSARFCVVDRQRRRAIGGGAGDLKVDGKAVSWEETNPLVEW